MLSNLERRLHLEDTVLLKCKKSLYNRKYGKNAFVNGCYYRVNYATVNSTWVYDETGTPFGLLLMASQWSTEPSQAEEFFEDKDPNVVINLENWNLNGYTISGRPVNRRLHRYERVSLDIREIRHWYMSSLFSYGMAGEKYKLTGFRQRVRPLEGWESPKWQGWKNPQEMVRSMHLTQEVGNLF